MILIFANNESYSVQTVLEELENLGANYTVLTPNDFYRFNIDINTNNIQFKNKILNLLNVNVVWLWRWSTSLFGNKPFGTDNDIANIDNLNYEMKNNMKHIMYYFSYHLKEAVWFNKFEVSELPKTVQMCIAKKVGFDTPDSIITTDKGMLIKFSEKNTDIITKSISDGNSFNFKNCSFSPYTSQIKNTDIKRLPNSFPPSLFQKKIRKEFEIRTFFIDGKTYSITIHSQNDIKTEIDFRQYNYDKPNRNNCFTLPENINNKIIEFCKIADLNTGSFDFIYTKEHKYVFLEVNPVGQFGMTSNPCNYNLEKVLAKILFENDKKR